MKSLPPQSADPAQADAARVLIEEAADGIIRGDRKGCILEVNAAALQLTGCAREELVGQHVEVLIPPQDRGRRWSLLRRLVAHRAVRETWEIAPHGRSPRWVEFTARWTSDGCWHVIARASAVRRRAGDEITHSEHRFRFLVDESPVLTWMADTGGQLTYVNRTLVEFMAAKHPADLLARGWRHWLHRDDTAPLAAGFSEAVRRQQPFALEVRAWSAREERYRWLLVNGVPRFVGGRLDGFVGTLIDFDVRKQGELRDDFVLRVGAAVRELTEPAVVANTVAAILGEMLGADRCVYADVAAGGEALRVVGNYARGLPVLAGHHPLGELVPERLRFMPRGEVLAVADTALESAGGDSPVHFGAPGIRALIAMPLLKSGSFVGCLVVHQRWPRRWQPHESELVKLAANACWESLERARVTQALREEARRLRFALRAARMVVWEVDAATGKAMVLDNAAELFGLRSEHSLNSTEEGFALMHPDDEPRHREEMARLMNGGGGYVTEFRMRRQDTGAELWIEEHAQAIRHADGRADRLVGIMVDITSRKRVEHDLREAHALLADKAGQLEGLVRERTAQLRETIGELEALSYSLAHDLRAPLRSLQGFSAILIDEYREKLDDVGAGYLRRIGNAAARMDALIQDVLSYSEVARAERPLGAVALGPLVEDIVATYPQLKDAGAEVSIAGDLPVVRGSEALLTQVFANLLGNAAKFVAPGVVPRIQIRAHTENGRARVEVEDNGIGVAPAQHEKIFGMFEQLNPSYPGTGMGLAIVRKAAERMGGSVGLLPRNEPGSIFWMELPLA